MIKKLVDLIDRLEGCSTLRGHNDFDLFGAVLLEFKCFLAYCFTFSSLLKILCRVTSGSWRWRRKTRILVLAAESGTQLLDAL